MMADKTNDTIQMYIWNINLFIGDCNNVKNLKHCVYNPNCELRGQDSLGRHCSTHLNDKKGWPKWCSCHRIRSNNI